MAERAVRSCRLHTPRRILLALALVVAAGALLRGHDLGGPSLWHDELASWVAATRPAALLGVLEVSGSEDMHPPGYYLLLRAHTRWFGDSEAALRFPSAIAGTLAIVALYVLGASLYGPREGAIAAVLCAFLPFPVFYSQEARCYSLLLLGAIVTVWLLVRARARLETGALGGRAGAPWIELFAFAVAGSVVAYLHYFGMLLIGLESAAALLLVRRLPRRRVAAAMLVVLPVALAALWLPWMSLAMTRRAYWPEAPSWKTPLRFFNAFFFSSVPLSALVLVVMGVAAAVFLARMRRERVEGGSIAVGSRQLAGGPPREDRQGFATVTCVLWIALPFAILLAYSWLRHSIVVDRAMIITLAPLYLLAARSVTVLLPRSGGQIAAMVVSIGLASGLWATTDGYRDLHLRQDYRAATAAYLAAIADQPGALGATLVVTPANTPLLTYYLDRQGSTDAIDVVVGNEEGLRELARVLRETSPPHLVLFCQLPRLLDVTTALVESRYDLVARDPFGGRLEVRRYSLREAATTRAKPMP